MVVCHVCLQQTIHMQVFTAESVTGQSLPLEGNMSSAGEEIPPILWKQGLLPCSQKPATGSYP